MEETRGLYIYESDDADSGEFTYFCIAPDTMKTTWHIEFRYGSELDALEKSDAGEYAYWLAAGISVDYTKADVENCIQSVSYTHLPIQNQISSHQVSISLHPYRAADMLT